MDDDIQIDRQNRLTELERRADEEAELARSSMPDRPRRMPTDDEIIDLALATEHGGEAGGDEPRLHYFRDSDIVEFALRLLRLNGTSQAQPDHSAGVSKMVGPDDHVEQPLNMVDPEGVSQFTKKPVTISAIRWTGKNADEVQAFLFNGHPHAADGWVKGDYVDIGTPEGLMVASVGDWIIRGVKGEHYPCKPDIFAATYDPARPQPSKKDRLLSALERAATAESALRALVDECENDAVPGWEERMQASIARANSVLSSGPTFSQPQPSRNSGELDEREAFEAWVVEQPGFPFAGRFLNLMWAAWQARAAIAKAGGAA